LKLNIRKLFISRVLPALVLFFAGAAVMAAARTKAAEYGDKELALISRVTAQILSRNHYRQQPLDVNISRQFFDEYLNELDPGRIYFSLEDVTELSKDRDHLCEQLQAGDSSFAFKAYDLFRKRLEEYRTFAEKRLKEPFDFTLDESYMPDRSKEPRTKDMAELEHLWYLRLKNDVLAYRLINRVREEERARMTADERKKAATAAKWEVADPAGKVLSRLRDISNDIRQKERVDILGIYLNSLAQVYGPHSNYYPPKLEEDFEMAMNLSLSGIGATLTSDGGYIKIVALTPGGPAARDGRLKVEDRIIAVAQGAGEPVDVVDMPVTKAVQLIRGPEKTQVTLTVLPGEKGRNAVPETVTLTRDKIVLVDSEAKGEVKTVKDDEGHERKIGVINLPGFYMNFDDYLKGDPNYKSCSRDVRKILEDFKKEKVDAVVMDLRRNGGGSFPEAISLTGLFIKSGPVVQMRSANKGVQVKDDTDDEEVYTGPLVVLVSKLSASAAEIFTGAIRDWERGVIVGDSRTFGKGTVLDVIPLDRYLRFIGESFPAGSTTYETAMYFRPTGGSVQQLGVASDIRLPSLTDRMELGEMFMNNHLPWDSVKPVKVESYTPHFADKVAKLKTESEERVKADPEFVAFRKKLDAFDRYKDRKTISLNEESRWKEYNEEKQLQEEADKIDDDASANKDGKKKNDIILDEATHIAADFADLEAPTAAAK